jgi:hypothetical protein
MLGHRIAVPSPGELRYDRLQLLLTMMLDIKGAFKDNPGRGSARIKDTRVYYVGQERNLTSDERADFLKIVSTAEAAL